MTVSKTVTYPRKRGRFPIRSWIRNNGFKLTFLIIWTAINLGMFYFTYYQYKYQAKYYYLREMLGLTLCISRGSAATLNLNSAALLLPMCRSILVKIRGCNTTKRYFRRCIDRSHFIHIVCAVYLLLGTVIHVVAHSYNAIRFSSNYNSKYEDVNAAQYQGQSPCSLIFTTVAGTTGSLMLLLLFLICVSSLPVCRRNGSFEFFWYLHHLFIVYYVLFICHSLGGLLKEQCNLDTHTPGCMEKEEDQGPFPEPAWGLDTKPKMMKPSMDSGGHNKQNEKEVCVEKPSFIPHRSQTWCYLLIPVTLYLLEKFWRWYQCITPAYIQSVHLHPNDVIEIELYKKDFCAKPGQYVLLNCRKVSSFEWHPFTITKCPSENNPTFSVHVRVQGDWTAKVKCLLQQSCGPGEALLEEYSPLPCFLVDGPFGSPSEDVLQYRTSVCIAGGVGITPFASILNALKQNVDDPVKRPKLKRLYLIWVCRKLDCFHWFADIISELYWKLWEMNCPDLLNIRFFITGDPSQSFTHFTGEQQFLLNRVTLGRPNFEDLFQEVQLCNEKSNIGVFVCGPRKLAKSVHILCNRYSTSTTKFYYNKERF